MGRGRGCSRNHAPNFAAGVVGSPERQNRAGEDIIAVGGEP